MAGVEIHTVYAGIAGSHIRGPDSDGVAAIAGARGHARRRRARAREARARSRCDADRKILHVLPREYIVDDQDGIRDPIGMSGVRLEARVNLVTAATHLRAERHPLRRALRPHVADVVLEPLASADAVLQRGREGDRRRAHRHRRRHHRPLVYADGGIAHTSVIPVGGNNITNDIAAGLRTPMAEAERLKRNYGCASAAWSPTTRRSRCRASAAAPPRALPRAACSRHHRAARRGDLQRGAPVHRGDRLLEHALAGVVLTGGAALLEGMAELRRGDPRHAGAARRPGRRRRHRPAWCRARSTRPASASCTTARQQLRTRAARVERAASDRARSERTGGSRHRTNGSGKCSDRCLSTRRRRSEGDARARDGKSGQRYGRQAMRFSIEFADRRGATGAIKVIGVGGCGGNAINTMIHFGLEGVEFIAANTDAQALGANLAPRRSSSARTLTRGLGAGADPESGRKAALEDVQAHRRGARRAPTWCSSPPAWAAAPAPARRRSSRSSRAIRARSRSASSPSRSASRAASAACRTRSRASRSSREHVDTLITIPNQKLLDARRRRHLVARGVPQGRRGAPPGRAGHQRPHHAHRHRSTSTSPT